MSRGKRVKDRHLMWIFASVCMVACDPQAKHPPTSQATLIHISPKLITRGHQICSTHGTTAVTEIFLAKVAAWRTCLSLGHLIRSRSRHIGPARVGVIVSSEDTALACLFRRQERLRNQFWAVETLPDFRSDALWVRPTPAASLPIFGTTLTIH